MLHRAIIVMTYYARGNTCYTSGVYLRCKGTAIFINNDKYLPLFNLGHQCIAITGHKNAYYPTRNHKDYERFL